MNTTPTDHKIEFMAWDKRYNELLEDEFIIFNRMVYRGYREFEDGRNTNDLELMQLTALRSINDEPIYNHMIVKNELGSYYLADMFDYTIMYILSNEKLEIVGNRFQSPELLELCK